MQTDFIGVVCDAEYTLDSARRYHVPRVTAPASEADRERTRHRFQVAVRLAQWLCCDVAVVAGFAVQMCPDCHADATYSKLDRIGPGDALLRTVRFEKEAAEP